MATLSSSLKLGNTGVSSLVRSAATLSNQLNAYKDTVAKLTFDNSARTDGDLQAYQDYLNGRVKTLESTGSITDATKALTMRQEIVTATKSNMSFNIQRATIAVLDGQGTSDDKLAAIGNAFQKLYSIGDLAAAQQYEQQYYSYYQTVQLQKAQAAEALAKASGGGYGGYGSSGSGYSSLVTAAEDQIKNNIQNANAAFAAQGPKFLDQQSNAYLKNNVDKTGAHVSGSASIFAALAGQVGMVNKGIQLNNTTKYQQGTYTPGSMLDIYTQALALDPSHAASYQSKIDSYLNGATGIALPGEGNKSITYNALMNTVYAGNSGNAPYGLVKGADGGWEVQPEHVQGYTYGKDMNGNTKLMPNYSFFDQGIPQGTANALRGAGINVKSDSNGDYWFQATKQGSFLSKVLGNYPTQGAVQKDGSVEFVGQDGNLYKMVKGSNNLYGLQEINQFGQIVNPNVAGQYGFKPPQNQGVIVTKGSTDFMTRTLGDSATPQFLGNKVVYQGQDGKLYQLVADTRGLHALQEIDKNGKILNNNVAGQYGFNPNAIARGDLPGSNANGAYKGQQFVSTLLAAHEAYMSNMKNVGNPNFHLPGSLYGSTPQWLGVSALIQNAQLMQKINQAHNQAMIALAAPPQLPVLSVLPVPQAPHPVAAAPLRVAPAAPQPHLNVAASHPTAGSVGQATTSYSPQPATQYTQNVPGISLNANPSGPRIRL